MSSVGAHASIGLAARRRNGYAVRRRTCFRGAGPQQKRNPMRAILDLCGDAPVEYFEHGDVLLKEGRTSGRLFVLIKGELEVFRGGAKVTVLREPGSIVGEMSILLGVWHTATVLARGDVRAHAIADAHAFAAIHPDFAWLIARMLARRLNAATTYLADLKAQFAASGDHWSMVGEVLESLIHQQSEEFQPGSDRDPGGM
jgi:CRP-like cAMP-binding protein